MNKFFIKFSFPLIILIQVKLSHVLVSSFCERWFIIVRYGGKFKWFHHSFKIVIPWIWLCFSSALYHGIWPACASAGDGETIESDRGNWSMICLSTTLAPYVTLATNKTLAALCFIIPNHESWQNTRLLRGYSSIAWSNLESCPGVTYPRWICFSIAFMDKPSRQFKDVWDDFCLKICK